MTDQQDSRPTPLGIYDRPNQPVVTVIEIIALGLSAIWLIGSAVFFMSLPKTSGGSEQGPDTLRFIMTMLAIFLPIAMIWVATTAARASRVMREESRRLQGAIDAIRQAYVAQSQGRGAIIDNSVAKKLDEIAAAQKKNRNCDGHVPIKP